MENYGRKLTLAILSGIAMIAFLAWMGIGSGPETVDAMFRPTEILLPGIVVTFIRIVETLCPGFLVFLVFAVLLERYAKRSKRARKEDN